MRATILPSTCSSFSAASLITSQTRILSALSLDRTTMPSSFSKALDQHLHLVADLDPAFPSGPRNS